ncbi:MAG: M48 family metalloprotease [Cytophagaceae bacterium]|jgi:predicted Zn-dependent protease|nr:M48 family metalloprotease [Cytophagaceae bacterium]
MKKIALILFSSLLVLNPSCKKKNGDGGINLFSLEDDKKLGAQVAAEIAANPAEYPILSETSYPTAYSHLRRITNSILNSGRVNHKDDFDWTVKIIRNDTILNAFCTPGGYIYVYTGIIKYLDTEDQLAGVMGHEIAHADRRHSTDAMTREYGLSILFDIVLGKNQGKLTEIAKGLSSLKYSRGNESEADEYSVIYLSGTGYQCNGAGGFFQKLLDANSGNCEAGGFLSTHPCPDNRVQAINEKATLLGCTTTPYTGTTYQDFKNSLP